MKYKFLYFALIAGLCFTNSLSAIDYEWEGNTSTEWNDPTNWDLNDGTFPNDLADNVTIVAGVNNPETNATVTIGTLTINNSGILTIGTGITTGNVRRLVTIPESDTPPMFTP